MSVYKRGSVWWIKFTDANGKEVRRSSGTTDKAKAQEWEAKLRAESWEARRLGVKPSRSWKEAVVRYMEERHVREWTAYNNRSTARMLDQYLGELNLQDITSAVLDGIISDMVKQGYKPGSINERLAFVRGVMRKAKEDWEWIDKVPKFRRMRTAEPRVRWLTREEADRLIECLPEWLAVQARFTLATGLRANNVRLLEWSQVDLNTRRLWVASENTKGRKSIGLPLNRDAVVVLREQLGKHSKFVFTKNGDITNRQSSSSEWYLAINRAGLRGLRWHELRHTWASWHVQSGTPLAVLRELGGWSSLENVMIYAHLAPEHLASAAENVSTLRRKAV